MLRTLNVKKSVISHMSTNTLIIFWLLTIYMRQYPHFLLLTVYVCVQSRGRVLPAAGIPALEIQPWSNGAAPPLQPLPWWCSSAGSLYFASSSAYLPCPVHTRCNVHQMTGLLVMLSRFIMFCLILCLFSLSYADQMQSTSDDPAC